PARPASPGWPSTAGRPPPRRWPPRSGWRADVMPGLRSPAGLRARIGQDHMMRNALWLMSNASLQAGLGFGFLVAPARLFSAADVGRAASLISASTILAYLALLGLNNAFGRFLPTAPDRHALVSAGLTAVAASGAVFSACYLLATPLIAPALAFAAR